jgi:hypothetical protein
MHARRTFVVVVALCSVFTSVWRLPDAAASEGARVPAEPLAKVEISASHVDWQAVGDHEHLTLTIAGPGGLYVRRELGARETLSFSALDAPDGRLLDGVYAYELRAQEGEAQWGHLWVHGGSFMDKAVAPPLLVRPSQSESKSPLSKVTANTTIPDDLVVQGQACIGSSCVDGDANGPALRLKETNNYQILFDALNCCFPWEHRWAIQANEPGSDGNFSIRDISGGTVPFRIDDYAPDNALTVLYNGNIGLGTLTPAEKLHVYQNADANTFLLVENPSTGASAAGVLRAKSDTATVNFQAHGSGRTISRFGRTLGSWAEFLQTGGNGLIIGTLVDKPLILGTNSTNRVEIGGTGGMTVNGNFTATGTKNFAVVDPDDAHQAIYYAALEGPEAGTYFRGTARTSGGEAVIELPDYFARLTEPERMTVQLTPQGTWGQLYVAEKTPGRIVVRVPPGSADVEFDYFVQGVRKGYLDYQVKRPNTLPE